jgi:hypothetical protein
MCRPPCAIFIILLTAGLYIISCGSSQAQQAFSASETRESTDPPGALLYDSGPLYDEALTGIAIASRYNPDSERQYEQLLRRAETDLRAGKLTSVYVAWYSMNDLPVREWAEFAIRDEQPLEFETIDSTLTGTTLIYRVAETDTTALSDSYNSCGSPDFSASDIYESASCWHVRARAEYSEYDAHPSFVKARQQALADLSQHLGIMVQSLARQTQTSQEDIVHQYAKYIFRNNRVTRLKLHQEELYLQLSVPKEGIIKL